MIKVFKKNNGVIFTNGGSIRYVALPQFINVVLLQCHSWRWGVFDNRGMGIIETTTAQDISMWCGSTKIFTTQQVPVDINIDKDKATQFLSTKNSVLWPSKDVQIFLIPHYSN